MNIIEQRIKQLRLLHSVMSLSLTVVLFVAYYMLSNKGVIKVSGAITAQTEILLVACVAALVITGYLIFQRRSKRYRQLNETNSRMEQIRIALIILYAFLESAVILSTVVFYITGARNFFLYGLLIVVYLLYLRPNDERMNRELGLEDS